MRLAWTLTTTSPAYCQAGLLTRRTVLPRWESYHHHHLPEIKRKEVVVVMMIITICFDVQQQWRPRIHFERFVVFISVISNIHFVDMIMLSQSFAWFSPFFIVHLDLLYRGEPFAEGRPLPRIGLCRGEAFAEDCPLPKQHATCSGHQYYSSSLWESVHIQSLEKVFTFIASEKVFTFSYCHCLWVFSISTSSSLSVYSCRCCG